MREEMGEMEMANIKYFVMDVDGTLTDGMIYMGGSGEAFKAFNIKDGCGIKEILPRHGIIPVIITARTSEIMTERCKELGITEIYQGCVNKLDKLKEIVGNDLSDGRYGLSNIVYAGDDLLDIPVMEAIQKYGGLAVCPNDAIHEIKEIADYVSPYDAGRGAVRDIIEFIISKGKLNVPVACNERVCYAIEYLESLDLANIKLGRYIVNDFFYYTVKKYLTREETECEYESYRKHVVIQWMLEGTEIIHICDARNLDLRREYGEKNDVAFFKDAKISTEIVLREGSYVVIPYQIAHKSCIQYKQPEVIKKMVGKIRID